MERRRARSCDAFAHISPCLVIRRKTGGAGASACSKSIQGGQTAAIAAMRADLEGKRVSELRKLALAAGADRESLAIADDADDRKGALVDLTLQKEQHLLALAESSHRAKLESMPLSELHQLAEEIRVDQRSLDQADDGDDTKTAILEIILTKQLARMMEAGDLRRSLKRFTAAVDSAPNTL